MDTNTHQGPLLIDATTPVMRDRPPVNVPQLTARWDDLTTTLVLEMISAVERMPPESPMRDLLYRQARQLAGFVHAQSCARYGLMAALAHLST